MITLEQISTKLDNILNGVDEETSSLVSPANEKYFFKVATEGLSFTNQNDMISGKNFIPVFIGSFGGEFNPVKGLGQADLQIQVQFYYQADLKEDFYKLTDFLVDVFVGGYLTFGTQKAVCNIEPPTYGELQTNDITKFKEWVTTTYKQPIKVSSVYMTMTMTLHISTAKDVGLEGGFMYGNDARITRVEFKQTTYAQNGTPTTETILTDETPIIIERADINDTTPASQQILDSYYAKGIGANTSVVKQLPLIIKNTSGYKDLLSKLELDRAQQSIFVEVDETIDIDTGLTITTTYQIINYSRGTSVGKLFSISLTLTPRA